MSDSLKKAAVATIKFSWAELGTSIFAFLNIVVASITVAICLNFMLFYLVETLTHTDFVDAFMWSMCFAVNIGAVIIFGFAVILYLGVYQKKPSFVLAYFIYGVFVVISLVSGVVTLSYKSSDIEMRREVRILFDDNFEVISHVIMGICVVYTLLLIMICRAWYLMRSRRRSQDHQKLSNDFDEADWRID